MSTFDPAAFMQTQFQGANSTQYKACPVGEYPAVVDKVTPREWTSKADPSKSGVALDIIWSIDSPAIRADLGRDKVFVPQGIFLDLTPSGGLDLGEGKNVKLGQAREACGINDPNRAFALGDFVGKVARVKVEHEIYNNEPRAKVTGVSRL
jgi:hypothetical protein